MTHADLVSPPVDPVPTSLHGIQIESFDSLNSLDPLASLAAGHSVDALGDTIAELASRLHAATYELLVLLRAFDARQGWNNGFRSCAHWLQWRTGIDLGAAREKVRVAHALADLPLLSAAMSRESPAASSRTPRCGR